MGASTIPVLATRELRKYYAVGGGQILRAVDGVSLSLNVGETLALVGESGSGKTTFGRTVMRLEDPTSGDIALNGEPIATLRGRPLRSIYRVAQMVFQNPMTSLSPRYSVLDSLSEPLRLHGVKNPAARRDQAAALLGRVHLRPELLARYPHELSGGQRQRVGIARALALGPKLIVADEPTASLDVSTQAQMVNLLLQLQAEMGLAYLFITHHLGLARHLAHRTAVMYLGRIVELAPSEALFAEPLHPYTAALVATRLPGRSNVIEGNAPSAVTPPPGCHFSPRCPIATALCRETYPDLTERADGHFVACHHPGGVSLS